MTTNAMTGTILNQAGYNGGWIKYGSDTHYAGFGTTSYFTTVIAFQTPAFLGMSEAVSISISAKKNGDNSNPTVRWALATSDVNRNIYVENNNEITQNDDSCQLKSGVYTFQGITTAAANHTLDIETSELKPSTTYYLYLWGYESNNWLTVYYPKNHSVSVAYTGGIVYIDDGNELEPYSAYIDNGSSWDLYLPYIDNGSGWDLCS
jgi:hypothetical protein